MRVAESACRHTGHPEGRPLEALREGTSEAGVARTFGHPPAHLFLSFHFPETGMGRVTGDVLGRLAECPEYEVTQVEVAKLEPQP